MYFEEGRLFFIKSQFNGRVLDVEDGSTEVRIIGLFMLAKSNFV